MTEAVKFALVGVILFHAALSWGAEPPLRKYHPGHYVALPRYDDSAGAITDSMRSGVVGVQVRYTWRELEPSYGNYDFTPIAEDLNQLSVLDGQLVAFLVDKSFNGERFTPEYLWDDHTLPFEGAFAGPGYVAKRWDPYVVERMKHLLSAMATAFDAHPRFEGVAIQETALGLDDATLVAEGYTAERYRDALMDVLQNGAAAMPRSRVFWYANFLPWGQAYLADVADGVTPHGVAVGGPDVLPDNWALENLTYPILRDLGPEVMVFNSAQFHSYRHEHLDPEAATRYWTPREIMEFARDDLKVRYLFWNRLTSPQLADSYSIHDAYPLMAEGPLQPQDPALIPMAPLLAQ